MPKYPVNSGFVRHVRPSAPRALYDRFNVPPEPRGSTSACLTDSLEFLGSLLLSWIIVRYVLVFCFCCKGEVVSLFIGSQHVVVCVFTVDILRIGELYAVFGKSIRFVNALILTVL